MKIRSGILAGVVALAFAGAAQAVTIMTMDEHVQSLTDWADTLTVDQFDPSLGTLNSVTIRFEAAMISDMILDNDNVDPENVIGNVNVTTFGTFEGFVLAVNLSDNTGLVALAADDSGNTDAPGDGGLDEGGPFPLADNDFIETTLFAGLAPFIGLGNLSTVGLGTIGGFGVAGSAGNVDVSIDTEASAKLIVTYDFDNTPPRTGVPEPITATLGLMGLGVLGMATRRRMA